MEIKINPEIALNVAMERIVALENELIYAKTVIEQLNQEIQHMKEEEEENK